jgi:DNA repair ATPase RecN
MGKTVLSFYLMPIEAKQFLPVRKVASGGELSVNALYKIFSGTKTDNAYIDI